MIAVVANVAGRFGMKPKEVERFIKFAVVGVIGAVVDFGVFNILRPIFLSFTTTNAAATWAVTIASTISFLAAIASNFLWNRFWTYPDSRSKSFRRQFTQFTLVNFAGVIIRAPFVALTHDYFAQVIHSTFSVTEANATVLGDNLALAVAVVIVMFWNFFVNRYWTYNDVE